MKVVTIFVLGLMAVVTVSGCGSGTPVQEGTSAPREDSRQRPPGAATGSSSAGSPGGGSPTSDTRRR